MQPDGCAPASRATPFGGSTDAFAVKANSAGTTKTYSTYLGGSGSDDAYAIAVDPYAGTAYLTGGASSGFPTTSGAYDTTHNGSSDAYLTQLNAAGSALEKKRGRSSFYLTASPASVTLRACLAPLAMPLADLSTMS